jgi:hypothetical protein
MPRTFSAVASNFSMVRTSIEKFEATAEIVLSKGPKPANEPKAFDAKQVIENLGPKIVRPKP